MRPLVVLLALSLSLTGCSRMFGRGSGDVEQSVPVSADSTLGIAATQLRHHGYTVNALGENAIITAPRPVPEWLGERDGRFRGRQWMVQVTTEPMFLARGSRFTVAGFLLPENAPTVAAGGTPSVQNAIPITSEHQLYQELRAIAGWIGDAGRR